MFSNADDEEVEILERLREINKEYMSKKRKLKRCERASKAKAHVRQRLAQEAERGLPGSKEGQKCCRAGLPVNGIHSAISGHDGGKDNHPDGSETTVTSVCSTQEDVCELTEHGAATFTGKVRRKSGTRKRRSSGLGSQRRSSRIAEQCGDDTLVEVQSKKASPRYIPLGKRQLGDSECVREVVCCECRDDEGTSSYIVCLCRTALQVFNLTDHCWTLVSTHSCKVTVKKKAGRTLFHVPDPKCVQVVVLENQSSGTTACLYSLQGTSLHRTVLDTYHTTSIVVFPMSSTHLFISQYKDQNSHVTVFTTGLDPGAWDRAPLEPTDQQLTTLTNVRGLQEAVLGVTAKGMGFLILPMLSCRRGREAGSVVVVNPQFCSSEILLSLRPLTDTWAGCSSAGMMSHDLLVAKETNGMLGVWDVFTGCYLATIDDVTITCFGVSNEKLVMCHKDCVHIFQLL
ncbi:hypothetical protein MAR_029354 [Mya arenaria]|uniref:Partner and localizer of BRCA2 n=1 Tax=Mya arenaria TaxID=6604 RepID=A0ABY7DJK2_MYAAR|nr:hypothetical protein MAR_029354 [Mya arenaria]